jgi:excinuclease ABC subunit C
VINVLKSKIKDIPNLPGCYLMKNETGVVIYVGKAKGLRDRIRSYFNSKHTGKTKVLVDNIKDFDYMITKGETEALILELNLIKQYNPKFNILLRDDKTYPYIELTNEKYPRLLIIRNNFNRRTKTKLFGPYPNVYAARKTINMLNRIYPLRKCNIMGKKECLYYHIDECIGYCIHNAEQEVINQMISEITKFLNGNNSIIIKKIETEMYKASNKLNYERAKELKELLDDIKVTLHKQVVDLHDYIDRDVFNYYVKDDYISIQVFYIRGGKLVERDSEIYPIIENGIEELTYYICSFYDKNNLKPKEILVSDELNVNLLMDLLNIKVTAPKKGKKKELLMMAKNNAKITLEQKLGSLLNKETREKEALKELSELLNVSNIHKIEVFDNSHLFGTYSVSGMVVFIDGKPAKKEYRKYKIISDYSDDYNLMKEVIYRRYFKVIKEKLSKPDLIMVDGGKIQVNATLEVLADLKLKIPVCGLKKDEHHKISSIVYSSHTYDVKNTNNLYFLLGKISEEVHRWTISYHKNIRSKGSIESVLDNVSGIGKQRKIKLLKKYGSIDKIKEASHEELSTILPMNIVKELKLFLEKL